MEDPIEQIRTLPKTRPFTCCGRTTNVSILQIYGQCPECGQNVKMRRLGSVGSEIEDVIDAVLEWMGTGKDFEMAMRRKREIDHSE